MSFWDWDEYEAFLDWSAMNGFNLMLDIIGQEEVLRRTLNEFGYSDEEVKEFISGDVYKRQSFCSYSRRCSCRCWSCIKDYNNSSCNKHIKLFLNT